MINAAQSFLRELDRADVAAMLDGATARFIQYSNWLDEDIVAVELTCPQVSADLMGLLAPKDQQRIIEAFVHAAGGSGAFTIVPTELKVIARTDMQPPDGTALLLSVMLEKAQLVSVATGGLRIPDINDHYRARRRRIATELAALGLDDPNSFEELWDWYNYYSANLQGYASRRAHIASLFDPLISKLQSSDQDLLRPPEPTGWERVDRGLEKAFSALRVARHPEDCQTIGLLCREILISVGQAIYEPSRHRTADGTIPSATDAARMIEAFIVTDLAGGSNEVVRAHAKASLKLVVELQHRRTADYRLAALSIEATRSVAETMAILSGRRDRES